MGVAGFGVMADHAQDMSLMTLSIEGIAHRFTVDGQRGVVLAPGLTPALQSTVETNRIDPNHDIANDRFAGHDEVSVDPSAAKSLSGFRSEAGSPIGHRFVTAHATESCGTSDGQHGG